jgi:hypothetical protein
VIVSALHLSGAVHTQTSNSYDFAHFTYDRGASLNVKQNSVKVLDGVTIQDITYTGSDGDTVPAYLVIPKGSGKFTGVIWGHWLMPGAANSNRKEFLEEAVELAPAGVVSLLVDAPKNRPDFKEMPDPVLIAQQVVDLRRGLDLHADEEPCARTSPHALLIGLYRILHGFQTGPFGDRRTNPHPSELKH